MNTRYYERNSGVRRIEEMYSEARYQAEGFQVVLYEYARYHLAQELLSELQAQLDEENKKVEGLRKEIEKAEKQKNRNRFQEEEYSALRKNFTVQRVPVDELARCVIVLKSVERPEFPEWLSGFLGEVMNGDKVSVNVRN